MATYRGIGGAGRDPADTPSFDPAGGDGGSAGGAGPWRLGWRRLRRNRIALASGALFLLLVAATVAAPLWSAHVAHTGPLENHLTDQVAVGGERVDVVSLEGVPIGPTWRGEFFLGADPNGRDVMVRLLYGGRNSLAIGLSAALITGLLATLLGLAAGYFRGWVDAVVTRAMDVLWAFPVVILGVALGVALALGGIGLGPVTIRGDSLLVPILVIGVVYVPYMARPIRGQVLALREKEFVDAARVQGAGPLRVMASEILPNLSSTVLVFFPLMVANAVLLEAALSFLGAGVRPPQPSWGGLIDDGVDRIVTAPHIAIAPGLMLVATVLALNVFADGVRDAIDPRARVGFDRR